MKQFLKRAFHQSKPHLRWLWPWIMRSRSLLRAIPVDKIPVSSKYFGRPKGYYRTTHEYLASPEGERLRNSCREIYPAETLRYKLPATLDQEVHWKFRENLVKEMPPSYVFELENARFWGHYGGSIITADDRLVADLSPDVLGIERHRIFTKFKLPKCRRLKGTVAVLSTPEAATNYWHWTFDLLPRLHLLEKAGFSPEQVDYYLVNHTNQPYQHEMLSGLGISREQVIRTDDGLHVEAERMVVSSLKPTQLHQAKWACEFLGSLVQKEGASKPSRRRLYISRANAAFRRLLNEEEVFAFLCEHGFDRIYCEKLTACEQRRLFSHAEIVIAPHGAALANLVYCKPGTRVIECFPPSYIDLSMWPHISHADLHHSYLIGQSPSRDAGEGSVRRTENFTVSLQELEHLLFASKATHL